MPPYKKKRQHNKVATYETFAAQKQRASALWIGKPDLPKMLEDAKIVKKHEPPIIQLYKCPFCDYRDELVERIDRFHICYSCYVGVMDYIMPDPHLEPDRRFKMISVYPMFSFSCPNGRIVSFDNT